MTRPTVGLALSSGGARGAAHTGVLQVLAANDIPIDLIVGTSIGAMVGGLYAAGVPLERIEQEWLNTDLVQVAKNLMPTFSRHGWSSGSRVSQMLQRLVGEAQIEELPLKFVAVAADINSGEEVVIQQGPLVEAIRASASIPGLFVPAAFQGHLLVDGGLVNPLPVDVVRRLGAQLVIAVDLGYYPQQPGRKPGLQLTKRAIRFIEGHLGGLLPDRWMAPLRTLSHAEREELSRNAPGVINTLILASVILQRRIVKLTQMLTPPEIVIHPRLAEHPPRYYSARRGIEAGRLAAEQALPQIKRLLRSVPEDSL